MTFLVIEALMEILLCFVVVEACNSSSAQLFFVFFQKPEFVLAYTCVRKSTA